MCPLRDLIGKRTREDLLFNIGERRTSSLKVLATAYSVHSMCGSSLSTISGLHVMDPCTNHICCKYLHTIKRIKRCVRYYVVCRHVRHKRHRQRPPLPVYEPWVVKYGRPQASWRIVTPIIKVKLLTITFLVQGYNS